ncbi:copper transporter 2-like [Rutidosis leptorrhynchoides]|uniref:copper transporter 2-like n=1 Tax=Rutidosis leptorrhynchoides TaxID=125765 RepID=UPI003A98FD04
MAPPPMMNGTMAMPRRKKMMMHMTFYWGKDALILFTGWPGTDTAMYFLALVFVFFLALIVEYLARCNLIMMRSNAYFTPTLVYALRVGLGFMVMLSLMSFNVGVFLVAVLGHGLGFFFFRVIMKLPDRTHDDVSGAC